ncbi:MAG TPA: ABC transporter permease [Acidimicrobiales bacterium]
MSAHTTTPEPGASLMRRASRALHRHPRLRLWLLLTLPLVWLVVAYVGSLASLFLTAFFTIDQFTQDVVRTLTLENFEEIFRTRVYRTVAVRTVLVATAVTAVDAVIAVPMAFFMAKVAKPWARRALVVAVLMPLWAGYLVKAYAWRTILAPNAGVLEKSVGWSPGYGLTATTILLAYLWLPYMILPIFAGLERLPDSLLEASADLGATAGRTFRSVVLPILKPAVIAGSIFTFSLTLGDYIAVDIVGGKTQLLGSVVYDNFGANLPFAAAYATVPVMIMVVYLLVVRRSGALENL